jgi:hypothetical protein
LWINAGEERLDRHQLLAANRFEDTAEEWEDLEDVVGTLGTKGAFQKPDFRDVIGDTTTSFSEFVDNLEMHDEEYGNTENDTRTSDEDDE